MPKRLLALATLFFSASTLICCALPALFVTLGAGASFVSILGTFPQLIWFSEHKELIFGITGSLLLINILLRFRGPSSCPTDPALAGQCMRVRRASSAVLIASMAIFAIGGFFAFIAPLILG